MRSSGLTLIELLVVIVIIGILLVIAGFQFIGWQSRYRVEAELKDMFSNLVEARQRAMQENVTYLVELNPTSYTICKDSNGNGVCDTPDETVNSAVSVNLSKSNLSYNITWNLGGGVNRVAFNRRGLSAPNGRIVVVKQDGVSTWTDKEVDYDCINIFFTRIKMGKLQGATCETK